MNPLQLRWAYVTGGLTFVVLLAAALGTIPVIEPYAPATRGFARAIVAEARAQDAAQQLKTTVGILDLKLVALDGQLDALNNQLAMLILRLATADPSDVSLLRGFQKNLEAQIKDKTAEKMAAQCDKTRAQFPSATC